MIRRTIATSAIVALTISLTPAAIAAPGQAPADKTPKLSAAAPRHARRAPEKGTVLSLGEGAGPQLYIVQLEDAAVPSYTGGVKGLAPVQAAGRTFAPDAAREPAYRHHVRRRAGRPAPRHRRPDGPARRGEVQLHRRRSTASRSR